MPDTGDGALNSITRIVRKLRERYYTAVKAAEQELFWRAIPRQVAPSLIEEYPEYLLMNRETLVKCLVVGVPRLKIEGYPRDLNPKLLDELLSISTKGYTIAYSFTAV